MHRGKDDSCILNSSANVFRSIIPVDSHRIDRRSKIITGMKEFHDPREVIRFAGRLTDEVRVVCLLLEGAEECFESSHTVGCESCAIICDELSFGVQSTTAAREAHHVGFNVSS